MNRVGIMPMREECDEREDKEERAFKENSDYITYFILFCFVFLKPCKIFRYIESFVHDTSH